MDLQILPRLLDAHAPGQVRGATVGLHVEEVPPPAGDLADEQAKGTHIRQSGKGDLFIPGHSPGNENAGNDTAVNGQSPAVDI